MMTTLDQLYQALTTDLDDWTSRGILADWHEEAGQHDAAECVRWMIRQHKRPYGSSRQTYHWFNAARVTIDTDPESDLPEVVYAQLQEKEGLDGVFRSYATLRAAEEDLYAAWRRAREKGWSGDG